MMFNLRKWMRPPVFEEAESKTLSAHLLNLILWILILAAGLYGLVAPIEPEFIWRRYLFIGPFILLMLGTKQLLNQGYIRLVGNTVVAALWVLVTSSMLIGADYQNPAFMGYVVVVICAGLILSRRAVIGWVVLCILTSAVILQLGLLGILPPSSATTPPFAFWAAQATYIITSSIFLTQTLRKIDEARAHAQLELAERKRVEAERERVIKELESKNAELERFTYTVSNDLKSPLITIGGFIGLLEEDIRLGNADKFGKDLQRIREAKDKMHRLLNELLELSRIGRMMNIATDTPMAQIVEEALNLTRGRIMEKNIQVEVADELPTVHGDRPRLVEVLQNLIDNAAKFTAGQSDPHIQIGATQQGGETVFFVSDNGIGIEPVYQEKVFGLFDKLDPKSEGTGVGLALVKRIVEVHGGWIWVESAGTGRGSMFCFTLPVRV